MFRGTSFMILFGETSWFATKETILKGRIAMGMQMDSSTGMMIFAAAVISLALVFYTIGVFAERRSGTLKPKHLALFWTGFVFDTTGTTIMTLVANTNTGAGSQLHAITGGLALSLMPTPSHAEAIRAAMPIRCRIASSASASQAESPR